jgi:hypothetical protein
MWVGPSHTYSFLSLRDFFQKAVISSKKHTVFHIINIAITRSVWLSNVQMSTIIRYCRSEKKQNKNKATTMGPPCFQLLFFYFTQSWSSLSCLLRSSSALVLIFRLSLASYLCHGLLKKIFIPAWYLSSIITLTHWQDLHVAGEAKLDH